MNERAPTERWSHWVRLDQWIYGVSDFWKMLEETSSKSLNINYHPRILRDTYVAYLVLHNRTTAGKEGYFVPTNHPLLSRLSLSSCRVTGEIHRVLESSGLIERGLDGSNFRPRRLSQRKIESLLQYLNEHHRFPPEEWWTTHQETSQTGQDQPQTHQTQAHQPQEEFAKGEQVYHPAFGQGIVLGMEGINNGERVIQVRFGNETKRLSLSKAPLNKVSPSKGTEKGIGNGQTEPETTKVSRL